MTGPEIQMLGVERDKCYDALTLYAPTLQNSPDARQSLFVRIPPKEPKLFLHGR